MFYLPVNIFIEVLMKNSLLFLLAGAICFAAFTQAQQEKKYDLQERTKSSKIQTRTDYLYFLDKPGDEFYKLQKRYYDTLGRDTLIEIFSMTHDGVFAKIRKVYNEFDFMTEKIEYKLKPKAKSSSPQKKMSNDQLIEAGIDDFVFDVITKYEYNKNGDEIKQSDFDSSGNLLKSVHTSYVYNVRGNIIEIRKKGTLFTENKWEKSVYDGKGNIISLSSFDRNEKLLTKIIYSYDSLGRLTGYASTKSDSSKGERNLIKYDDQRRKIENLQYRADTVLLYKTKYFYNSRNNLIRVEKEDLNSPEKSERMVTDLDENGIILSITKYNAQNKPYRLQKFVYTFY